MARDDIKSKSEPGGFIEYGPEQLSKIDSMRRDKSQPDFYGVPILHDSDVMFTTASQMGNLPASCYTCTFQQSDLTCAFLGPPVKVSKVTGHADSGDPIEYWPCCDLHDYGKPQSGKPVYREHVSTPSQVGLIWINAPEVGQKYGGSNCGGGNGGDDCDHYMVPSGEKWDAPQGMCRVLQHTVQNGDDCAAWRDDDILEWEDAQQLIGGKSTDAVKKGKLAKSIIGRD
jgi:hypothetical protein